MATIDEVLSILLASKSIDELPTATNIQPSDWLIFFNVNTQLTEKIQASKISGVGGWIWIDDSWVEKDVLNTDVATLEVNDIVWFKDVTYSGMTITLSGWRYDGGDATVQGSYTKVKSIA